MRSAWFRYFRVGTAIAAGILSMPSWGLNVGYYEFSAGQGEAFQTASITNAGHTPVQLFNLDTAELAGSRVIFATNSFGSPAEWTSRLTDISNWVTGGGVLVLHDRAPSGVNSVLPGAGTFVVGPCCGADIDVRDFSTGITEGPGGVITNSTLDGGNWSDHGYVTFGSLPGGTIGVLSRPSPNTDQTVTFLYPYGAGYVVYSTIPLDHYLRGFGSPTLNQGMQAYAVNVVAFAAELATRNTAPDLASPGDKSVGEGQNLGFTLSASDPDAGDTLTYSTTGLPSGATLDPNTGVFNWTPGFDQAGVYNVTFTVGDTGGLTDSESIQITVSNTNQAPDLTNSGPFSVSEGDTLTFALSASDPDAGDALSFSATRLPAGASLDGGGAFTWTPGFDDAGSYIPTFRVCDNGTPQLCDDETVTIMVTNTNRAPSQSVTGSNTVDEGQTLTLNVSAGDLDAGDSIALTVMGLPSGASYTPSNGNPASGVFTWTPGFTQEGSYTVTFTATDNGTPAPLSDNDSITITVNGANGAPDIVTESLPAATEDAAYSAQVMADDPDLDSMTLSASGLPAGLGLGATSNNAGMATAIISGTPSNDAVGTHSVTITASDGNGGSDTRNYNLVVINVNDAPTVSPIPDQTERVGNQYSFETSQFFDDVDAGDTLSFEASGLPGGNNLTFNTNTGVIEGTPQAEDIGSYTVTITATDLAEASVSDSFALTILPRINTAAYRCYRNRARGNFDPHSPAAQGHLLIDGIDGTEVGKIVDFARPTGYCTPVSLDETPPPADLPDVACYKTRDARDVEPPQPRFNPGATQALDLQDPVLEQPVQMRLRRPSQVCLQVPRDPQTPPSGEGAYRCYEAGYVGDFLPKILTKGMTLQHNRLEVENGFAMDIRRPRMLCVPAGLDEARADEGSPLRVCYRTRNQPGQGRDPGLPRTVLYNTVVEPEPATQLLTPNYGVAGAGLLCLPEPRD